MTSVMMKNTITHMTETHENAIAMSRLVKIKWSDKDVKFVGDIVLSISWII